MNYRGALYVLGLVNQGDYFHFALKVPIDSLLRLTFVFFEPLLPQAQVFVALFALKLFFQLQPHLLHHLPSEMNGIEYCLFL